MEMAERSGGSDRDDFSELPEGCISDVVALTSPRDACRLSVVSSLLRTVADSDSVWARFLPPDISSVLSRASGSLPQFSSLKQLYFSLCNSPILLDGDKMSFSLDRSSGRKCYMLSARALGIAWGDTPRYWRWTPIPDSRFLEVAELITVCWLEIRGRIDVRMLSPLTLYAAYLVFKFSPDSHGFENQPIEVRVGLVDGEVTQRTVYLNSERRGSGPNEQDVRRITIHRHHFRQNRGLEVEDVRGESMDRYPKERGDSWSEIGLGEFFIFCEGDCDGEMEVKVLEVKNLFSKGGLIIHGIEIRPKESITM